MVPPLLERRAPTSLIPYDQKRTTTMNFSKVFFGLTACLFAASLTGCIIESTPPPPERVGSISVDVTIEGTTSPTICGLVGADRINVTIVDTGVVVDEAQAP